MSGNVQILEQRVEVKRTQPADLRVALEDLKKFLAQKWPLYFSTASVSGCVQKNAFDAVRHDAAITGPLNLSQTEPEEFFLETRPVTEVEQTFRGRRGKLTVIRK